MTVRERGTDRVEGVGGRAWKRYEGTFIVLSSPVFQVVTRFDDDGLVNGLE
jgi:hypothetical protein